VNMRESIPYHLSNFSDDDLVRALTESAMAIQAADHELKMAHITHEAARDELMQRGNSVLSLPDVSSFFSLSYANYLTVPRVLMEAMPIDWQRRFCALVGEMQEVFDYWAHDELNATYDVRLRGADGRYQRDPLSEYRRPNRDYIESLKRRPDDDALGRLVGDGGRGPGETAEQPGQGDGQEDRGEDGRLAALGDDRD
jgi:hypothetical protein